MERGTGTSSQRKRLSSQVSKENKESSFQTGEVDMSILGKGNSIHVASREEAILHKEDIIHNEE